MIKTTVTGSYKEVNNFFQKMLRLIDRSKLNEFGKLGVDMLREVTPVDTGLTRDSWYYKITKTPKGLELSFNNSNLSEDGVPVVIYIMYGHITSYGTWTEKNNFVKPVIDKLVKEIKTEIDKEVK